MLAEKTFLRGVYSDSLRDYYCAIIRMMDILNELEECEVFPRECLEQCISNVENEKRKVENLRKKLLIKGGYNVATIEPIRLVGCRLENGRVIGSSVESALHYASQWLEEFPKENSDCTMYEIGTYLLCLKLVGDI